ncbi:MAG: sodium:proton antiporter [Planctomycetales bacterium]|nr:sodium:proton antiporter [Planctomycetales bacterium]
MSDDSHHGGSGKLPLIGIILLVAFYIVAAVAGLPQKGTKLIVDAASHHGSAGDDHEEGHDSHAAHDDDHANDHAGEGEAQTHDAHAEQEGGGITPPGVLWTFPFVLLLLSIAVMPLLSLTEHWWESNLHRFYVAAGLGLITLGYYAFAHPHAIDAHWPAHHVVEPSDSGVQFELAWTVFANAMLSEYIPFIVLLFSLYTISGGIRISGDVPAHPLTNTAFIGVGGLLASFIGTTGAAMLLIRPLLSTNSERKHVRHTVIFFIFVVCNCGGCLLPIGDPPLFLGYLRGVPFLWTMKLFPEWLFVNCALLTVYWAWDHFYAYPHEKVVDVARDEIQVRRLKFEGMGINGILLAGVIFSVALLDPSKAFPGTDWHAWMYLREIVQLSLVALSLLLGSAAVREANRFNYHAIVEVAALFCGIFICMQPALQILNVRGPDLGVDSPMKFFWATGALSSFLDNAPTYVVFFETARTLPATGGAVVELPGHPILETFLIGISLGAVFMGAMTYIGNGPNFMVKAIAEASGIKMPSFFGYMVYSVCVLLPIFVITTLIFL